MCGGPDQNREKRKAEKRQRKADKRAKKRQEELDELARRREQIQAAQANTLAGLKAEAARNEQIQKQQVAAAKAAQARRKYEIQEAAAKELEAINTESERKAGAIRRAGQAAASSLEILNQQQPLGPTAKATKKGARKGGAKATPAGLSRGSASTKGTNLSI